MKRAISRSDRSMRRGAFTLVEMLITISVIVVLTALTVTASVVLVRKSEDRQTQNTLRLLDIAMQEWETRADRKLTFGQLDDPYPGATYDMLDGIPHVFTLTEALIPLQRQADIRSILAQIDPGFVYTYRLGTPAPRWIAPGDPDDPDPNAGAAQGIYTGGAGGFHPEAGGLDGKLAVLDAWDNPIRAVHAGRLHDAIGDPPTMERDPDGTVFLNKVDFANYAVEAIYGRAQTRRVLFVSAGPDGKFGDLSEAGGTVGHEQAHDNVYSYAVEDPHQ